jgi:hypothetical protein
VCVPRAARGGGGYLPFLHQNPLSKKKNLIAQKKSDIIGEAKEKEGGRDRLKNL